MNNWRTVSPWMTEDEAWNEAADLEMLGIHYNLEEREMSKNIICGKCGGLKRIETEPCEYDSTSGSSSTGFCGCSDQEIEEDIEEAVKEVGEARELIKEMKEMVEEYANYGKQEIRFCPYCGAALGIV